MGSRGPTCEAKYFLLCHVRVRYRATVHGRSCVSVRRFVPRPSFSSGDSVVSNSFELYRTVSSHRVISRLLACNCERSTQLMGFCRLDFVESSDARISRASALALSAVLRTTSLSYRNMPFSGIHRTNTPWPIVLWNSAQLITSARPLNLPKMVAIGWLGVAPMYVKWKHTYLTLLYLTLFYLFFRYWSYRPDHWNDLHARCLKRRELTKSRAFWRSHWWKMFFTGDYPFPKNFKEHFTCKSKQSNNFWTIKGSRKNPKPIYTKSWSRNRTVISLPV
jgi:hypothetical protein